MLMPVGWWGGLLLDQLLKVIIICINLIIAGLYRPLLPRPPPSTHLYESPPPPPGWYPGELGKQNVTLNLNESGSF